MDPSKVDLYTIVRAMNEDFSLLDCVDCSDACPRSSGCISRELWKELSQSLRRVLREMTLKRLIQNKTGAGSSCQEG